METAVERSEFVLALKKRQLWMDVLNTLKANGIDVMQLSITNPRFAFMIIRAINESLTHSGTGLEMTENGQGAPLTMSADDIRKRMADLIRDDYMDSDLTPLRVIVQIRRPVKLADIIRLNFYPHEVVLSFNTNPPSLAG